MEHFRIPHGIVINKYDLNKRNSQKIENYARQNKIPILGKLPYDIKFVEAVVNLLPLVVYEKRYEKIFSDIWKRILHNLEIPP